MVYMTLEHFRGDPVSVYRRFRDQGRLAPEGPRYINSWVTKDLQRCNQVMECDDPGLLQQWGEAVLAWWRGENERVNAKAAGDMERAAKLWLELVSRQRSGAGFPRTTLMGMIRPCAPPYNSLDSQEGVVDGQRN